MNKIPRKYKKFDKMDDEEFSKYILETYNRECMKHDKVYIVFNFVGRAEITSESKSMIVYWLDLFGK